MAPPIALQMYTVREYGRVDLGGALKRVAEIGYAGVEFAGLYDNDPAEIARLVAGLGLRVCSAHVGLPSEGSLEATVARERAFGNRTLIAGFGRDDFDTAEKAKAVAARMQKAAEQLAPRGMRLGMHNHEAEFLCALDGRYAYDVLLEHAPDVFSELDVYWAQFGGADPVTIVANHRSRLPYLHIKDGNLTPDRRHTAVGSGKLNIPAIVGAADPAVLEWVVVELDDFDGDMWDAVQGSYGYLTAAGLAKGRR